MTHHDPAFPGLREAGLRIRSVLLVLALVSLAAPAAARVTLETATGLTVTIHEPDDIAAGLLVTHDGQTMLQHPTAGEVVLETETHPWDTLVPADAAVVAAALESVSGLATDLSVDVFLLPGLPARILGSFARRDAIFLAPGLGRQAPETVAWLVTHELGHVLCWAAVDGRPERWAAYRELRGLDPAAVDAELPHAERHREIIAEDFRFLFGGPLATRAGTIENPDLPRPDAVAGLRELLASYVADPAGSAAPAPAISRAYPNPCRAQTTVELTVGDAVKAMGVVPVLEIYDVRGRLVQRRQDGRLASGRVQVSWDGTDQAGRRVPDGTYLYRIQGGSAVGQGRILLMRR